MDDVRAAIGTVHLRRLLESNAARGRIVAAYRDALDGYRGIRMPFPERDDATPAYHLAVLVLPKGGSRDAFRAKLTATRIQTSVHYPPTHRLAWYRAHSRPRKLPVTDAVAARLVTLPLYPHMGDARIRAVIEAVRRPAR